MGWRGTTAVNRGQKGIRASETERNRVFVALLPGSPRLGPPLSARVCPAQTLFLQIEPHVPPFTLSTHSLFTYPPLPPTLSFSCLPSPFLPFFSPPPLPLAATRSPFSLSLALFHPRLRVPLSPAFTGPTPPCAHTRQVVKYNKKASSFKRFALDSLCTSEFLWKAAHPRQILARD